MKQTIMYIHGWRGSFEKAEKLKSLMCDVVAYDYSDYVTEALTKLREKIVNDEVDVIVGSSFGGFLADTLAEELNLPVVLINPLTDPQDLYRIADFPKDNISKMEQIIESKVLSRNHKLVIINEDDKLLDPQKTLTYYINKSKIKRLSSGGHRCENFDDVLSDIEEFIRYEFP